MCPGGKGDRGGPANPRLGTQRLYVTERQLRGYIAPIREDELARERRRLDEDGDKPARIQALRRRSKERAVVGHAVVHDPVNMEETPSSEVRSTSAHPLMIPNCSRSSGELT